MKKIIIAITLLTFFVVQSVAQENLTIENQVFASNNNVETFKIKSEKQHLEDALNSSNYPSPGMRPGDELVKFSRMYYIGVGLVGGGTLLMIGGALSYNYQTTAYTSLLGGLMYVGGFVTMIASHSHIGKAGKIMNDLDDQYRREMQRQNESSFKLNATQDGIGLAYNF